MSADRRGFTIIEVMVAIVVLTVGILAMLVTSAGITRMIGQGRRITRAALVAESRLEKLRQQARATTPQCTALAGGTATQPGNIVETWTVTANGSARTLSVVVVYPKGRGTSTATVSTVIRCT